MKLKTNFVQSMLESSNLLEQIRIKSFSLALPSNTLSPDNIPLACDYFCWLHNGIAADYSAITLLLANTADLNILQLSPIYGILRGTLEKYADVLNLYMKRAPYFDYLNFLNHDARATYEKKCGNSDQAEHYRQMALEASKHVCKNFNTDRCNRLTRYYLLGDFNKLPCLEQLPFIRNFNLFLWKYDSYFSLILHNNVEPLYRTIEEKIEEILKILHYMTYTSLCLLEIYYPWPAPEIKYGQCQLFNIVNLLHSSDSLLFV